MRRRPFVTIVFAVAGACLLVSLGVWQLQRHAWKQDVIAAIENRISEAPVALPDRPEEAAHAYLPVRATGRIGSDEILVQSSLKGVGPGYRVIAPFETETGRRVLIDRGFTPAAARDTERTGGPATLTGNLHWPDEVDIFTPDPDREAGLWFARDVPSLSAALDTEPVLLVVRESSVAAPAIRPLPVGTEGITDRHLGYAIQWFLMAAAWVAMAGAFIRSQRLTREGRA